MVSGDRDRDVFDVEKGQLVFPVETSRRDRRVRQPVECDVVEDIVSREAFGLSVEDACDKRVTAVVVVEHPGSLAPRVQNFTLTAFLPSSPRCHKRDIINESMG
jgi:hypothetical protein